MALIMADAHHDLRSMGFVGFSVLALKCGEIGNGLSVHLFDNVAGADTRFCAGRVGHDAGDRDADDGGQLLTCGKVGRHLANADSPVIRERLFTNRTDEPFGNGGRLDNFFPISAI